ncbi:MAG: DUF4440 domain-containing protein [Actinomycetota bacterium]|nr:DUF4440 domain-containing protein [Actinomycetota bacterium]
MRVLIPSVGRWSYLLAIVATVACFRSEREASPVDKASLQAGVDSAATRLLDALRSDNSDSLMALMADDVVLMPPNEPVLKGKAAVRAWYDQFLTQLHTSSLTVSNREVLLGDGFATEIANFEWGLTPVAGGPAMVDSGGYMQVWRRDPNGRWLFSREIWNSSKPLAPASPGT